MALKRNLLRRSGQQSLELSMIIWRLGIVWFRLHAVMSLQNICQAPCLQNYCSGLQEETVSLGRQLYTTRIIWLGNFYFIRKVFYSIVIVRHMKRIDYWNSNL